MHILETAIRDELDLLWRDLDLTQNDAINRSMRCDFLVESIKKLTQLVGPIPREDLPPSLVESGLNQRLHAETGIAAPVNVEQVATERAATESAR
ncbi:hypothetical protein ACQEVG_18620 [Streptomyces sp. CA-135486]|uniref:hypothetical protein n=1 Tax=Streptomyces sp. CA-135486 TaxID=3240049 RepID=UPI003D93043F